MIHLSRLHDAGSIVVNADLIETIEACPDTTVTLMTRRKFVVADSLDTVIDKVVAYRHRINADASAGSHVPGSATQAHLQDRAA